MYQPITREELAERFGDEFTAFIISSMDEAALEARELFKRLSSPYDQTLGGTFIRWHLRQSLASAEGISFTAAENGFRIDTPFNLGVWFEFSGISVRAYKVMPGEYPQVSEDDP